MFEYYYLSKYNYDAAEIRGGPAETVGTEGSGGSVPGQGQTTILRLPPGQRDHELLREPGVPAADVSRLHNRPRLATQEPEQSRGVPVHRPGDRGHLPESEHLHPVRQGEEEQSEKSTGHPQPVHLGAEGPGEAAEVQGGRGGQGVLLEVRERVGRSARTAALVDAPVGPGLPGIGPGHPGRQFETQERPQGRSTAASHPGQADGRSLRNRGQDAPAAGHRGSLQELEYTHLPEAELAGGSPHSPSLQTLPHPNA